MILNRQNLSRGEKARMNGEKTNAQATTKKEDKHRRDISRAKAEARERASISPSQAPIANTPESITTHTPSSSAMVRTVIGRLVSDHIASIEADPGICKHVGAYHSILAHHMQNALDDMTVYVRSRKMD